MSGTVVIGLGNAFRRDDGVGLVVARRIEAGLLAEEVGPAAAAGRAAGAAAGAAARVLRLSGDAAGLLDAWDGADRAILIDALSAGEAPGAVLRLDVTDGPMPAVLSACSSHALGVAQAIELGRALGQLPPRLVVYAVAGADFGLGEGLSPAVNEVVAEVAARVLREVRGGGEG